MVAPRNEFAFDESQARAATERWLRRTPIREAGSHALSQGRFDSVEFERPPRQARQSSARPNSGAGRSARPHGHARRLQDLAGMRVSADEVDNPLVERVIGATRDFLSVEFLDEGRTAARAVARVVTHLGNGRFAYGTGFLVSPSLFLTNNHVLPSEQEASASVAEFDYALDGRRQSLIIQRYQLRPDLFFLTDVALDFALVGIAPTSELGMAVTDYGSLPLIADEGKIITGELVNIVQHPRGEMKQVVVREGRLCDMPARDADANVDPFTYYEADTEAGSSGSPVFNDQWEVIALHHSGVPRTDPQGDFLDQSGNVWRKGDDPTRLDWIANEGVRVSRLMAFLAAKMAALPPDDAKRTVLQSLVPAAVIPVIPVIPAVPKSIEPPVPVDRAGPGEGSPKAVFPSRPVALRNEEDLTPMTIDSKAGGVTVQTSGTDLTITVPLRITIGFGTEAATKPSSSGITARRDPVRPAAEAIVIEENFKPNPDYSNRPGFDPAFLGFDLPLPSLDNSVARQAATLADGGTELKYNHYSVIMNAARRIAFVSAVNVDVDARAQLGREGADTWSYDPRISKTIQTGPELYRNNPIDKGHLTRRQDGAWGDTQEDAQAGNDDTFHWTNCSPQHEVFNQSQKATSVGLLLWGNLENHVTDQAKLNKRRIEALCAARLAAAGAVVRRRRRRRRAGAGPAAAARDRRPPAGRGGRLGQPAGGARPTRRPAAGDAIAAGPPALTAASVARRGGPAAGALPG